MMTFLIITNFLSITLSRPPPSCLAQRKQPVLRSVLAPAGELMADYAPIKFNHTMIRVKDPKVSLQFYTEVRYIVPVNICLY